MKTAKSKHYISILVTIAITVLYFPILLLCILGSIEVVLAPWQMDNWVYYLVVTAFFSVSTLLLTCLSRALLSLKKPYLGSLIVCCIYSIISIVLFAVGDASSGIGVLIALSFVLAAVMIDNVIRSSLIKRFRNRSDTFASLCFSSIFLLAWTIIFLFLPYSDQGSVEGAMIGLIALMGYACFLGRLYDVFVLSSPKQYLTRTLSVVFMIGLSLFGMISNAAATDNGTPTVYVKSAIAFWITVGLLLYDLGHFVAGRIQKKTARESQTPLES